jgi:hypothetical protein
LVCRTAVDRTVGPGAYERWRADDVNPLICGMEALRGLIIGVPAHLRLDLAVLTAAAAIAIAVSGAMLRRLAK